MALLVAALLAWQWRSANDGRVVDRQRPDGNAPERAAADGSAAESGQSSTTPAPAQTKPPAPRSQDTAVALDAPALGFRASKAQRLDDLTRMMAADDLAPLLDEFKRRAAKGDADAAARMRDIYDECLGVHLSQAESMADRIPQRSLLSPPPVAVDDPMRQATLQIGAARCAGIMPPGDYRSRATQLSRMNRDSAQLAADLGYVGARIRGRSWDADPAVHARLTRDNSLRLLQEGTPEALMELSSWAANSTPFGEMAWMLAACARGYPCTESAALRSNICAPFGIFCGVVGWPEYIRQGSSARDWRRLQAERDQILALLQAGDLGALILSDEAIGDGG